MSESFVRFFALSEAAFSKEIADSDLWLPPSKQEVVEEVCEAVQEHAQVLLVGEPGAGKTCVLRAVRHRLPQAGYRLTYCHNATLGRRDFYRQLCQALGLTPAATAAAVFFAISTHVLPAPGSPTRSTWACSCTASHTSSTTSSLEGGSQRSLSAISLEKAASDRAKKRTKGSHTRQLPSCPRRRRDLRRGRVGGGD